MPLKTPAAPEAGLNMTPMIDIVFQLILFFLFNLRFKSLDYRIESELPKRVGIDDFPTPAAELPHIRLALFRMHAEDTALAQTRVKLAGQEWVLPDPVRDGLGARETTRRSIQARIEALRPVVGPLGEIDCPPPTGGLVPHGDVVLALDAFLAAKVEEVHFLGAANPIPKARRP